MRKFILVVTIFLLVLLICEIACRVLINPFYISEDKLNNFRVKIENKTKRGGIKIAMLGDSFTYGSKVAEDETISHMLSNELRKRINRDDVFVDNYGIPGTSSIEHYSIYKRFIANFDYDMLILNFFIDDLTPYYYFNTLVNPYKYCKDVGNSVERFIGLLNNLRSIEFAVIYFDLIKTSYKVGSAITPVSYMLQKLREKDSLRYRCAREYLKRIGVEVKNSGGHALFVLIPSLTLYDYQSPYPEEIARYETEVLLVAEHSGFEVIDTVAELRDILDQRLILDNDIHYNSKGYKLIAQLIADKVIEILNMR
ncbi:MAG: SGNH/GDSL hydrolase family protein [Deltaproteobacteria bacterium]|nr:SGNH/GDSL hydrolase family protein [Deltaproteobacteria bacterium]